MSVAFHPDGQTLASGSQDYTIKLWNILTGQQKLTLKHPNSVHCVAFSPDGQTLVGGIGYGDCSIKLWLDIAEAIRQRGGGQSQVDQLRSDYHNRRVGELANLAAEGDTEAETAIKILKQARKKQEKYGGK